MKLHHLKSIRSLAGVATLGLVTLIGVFGPASALAQNLIANGNFSANASSYTTFPGYNVSPNPLTPTGWTCVSNATTIGLNGYDTTVGTVFFDNNSTHPRSTNYTSTSGRTVSDFLFAQNAGCVITQAVTTASGTTYGVFFDAASRNGYGPGDWSVSIGGTTFDTGPGLSAASQWNGYGFAFLGGASATGLTFTGTKSQQDLANVIVTNVTGACWSGTASGKLGGTDLNFTGNNISTASNVYGGFLFFNDTAGDGSTLGTSNLTVVAGGVAAGTLQFNNSAVKYTIGSTDANGITGATALVKNGTNTVTLTGTNTYTGTTTVNAGTLAISSQNNITNVTTVNPNGTLVLSGSNSLAGALSVASGATLQLVANAGNTGGGISAAYNATKDLVGIGNGNLQLRSDSSVTFGNMAKSSAFPGSSAITVDVNQVTSGNNNNTLSIFPNGVFSYYTTVNVTGGNGYTLGVGYIDGYNVALAVNTTTANMNLGWVQYINALTKNGAGTLTLGKPGGVTYGDTGTMTVNAGTLKVGDPSSFNGSMALALAGTSVFDLNGTNATVSEITSSTNTATITDNSAGTGTSTLTRSSQSATETAIISDGPTRKVAVSMVNANGTTTPFVYTNANTFSGGLTLLNNGSGTRLRISAAVTTVGSPGAITSSPYGTGPITIGQAATDKAGILLDTATGITIENAIVFNTALGTDQPGIRLDTTGHIFSGTITANLANALFTSTGSASLTGQVTGSYGLQLNNTAISITLNNATANPNNYQGDTTLGTSSVLILGAANQIPDGVGAGNVTDNGTLKLNGNNETINGLNGSGIVDGISGTPTFTVGNNNATASFSGVIKNTAGTLALSKIGTGTQSLSGTNTYSGATTISAGVLQGVVGGSISNSAVTVSAASGNTAAFGVSIVNTNSQWIGSSLTVNNAGGTSGLQFNFGALTPSLTVAPLKLNGAVAFTTAPTITILGSSVPLSSGNGYPLLTWGSGSAPSLTGVTLVLPRVSGNLAIVGSTLYLQVTGGSTEPVSWIGGNGTWDVGNSGNIIWKDSSGAPTYYQIGDTVNFDNTLGSGGTVTNNVSVSPLAVTVNNPSADYTIAGSGGITGTASLTKSGAHTLTLGTANTYTGPTTVSAGTLALTGSLNGSAVTVASTGTVTESGTGVIAGSASLTNSGTATLAGVNTFSGGTTLSAGQLNINNGGSSAANSAIGTGALTIAGNGTIDNTSAADVTLQPLIAQNWNADFTYAGSAHNLNLGAGAVTLGSTRQVTVSSNNLSVGGAIGGGYGLIKAGAGNLTLASQNTYSGGTTVNGGTLTVANGGSTGGIRGALTINTNATVNLAHVDALGYGVVVNTVNINGGTLTNSSGGNEGYNTSFNLTGGTMSSSGGPYVVTAQTIASLASSTPSVVNAPLTLDNTVTLSAAAGTVPSGIDLELSGAIGGGAYGVTKTGTGTVQLDGANTYTGTTTISNGTLKVGSAVAFTGKGPLALAGSSVFDLNGNVANVTDINSSVNTAIITDNSSGAGTNTLTLSNQGSTETAIIQDGSAKKVAVSLANNNGSTMPFGFGTANTFSGGVTLLNTGNGTRLRVSALITGSPFGSGSIYIGQTNTDKAGILLDTVTGITITNNIVFNTALGTDVPGIRLDTTNHTFAGKITASLANAMFAGTGEATLSGQVTGPNGLQLNNTAVTITLSNATANANNYQGATILGTNSVLNLGAASQIPGGGSAGNVTNYGTFNLNGYSDTINGLNGSGTVDGFSGTPTLTLGGNNATGSFDGVIQNTAGTLALTKIGTGTETLNGGNTYTGNTTISAGTLALGSGGNINNSANLVIAAGGTFDVSVSSYFSLSGNTAVSASGTGTGSTAAVINGLAGGTLIIGSQAVTLNFTPTSSTGDLTHPALYIPQGSLNLNGQITVINNGPAMGVGTYNLISQASGTISGTPTLFPVIGGHGLAPATTASIQVSAGNVQLDVVSAPATTTTLTRDPGTSANSTYGDTLTFDVSVSPGSATGTVVLNDGTNQIGTATLSGATCTITPAYNALTAGIHTNITAVYSGDANYASSKSAALSPAQTVSNLVITATATANSKLYDGTTNATITGTLNSVLGSDIVTFIGTGYFASAAVGTNKPVTSTATLGGASAGNYYLTPLTGLTADILSETVWTGAADALWSTTGNWLDNIVGNGIGVTADFSTLDITAQTIVALDEPVTLGNLIFGGTDTTSPSSWYLSANSFSAGDTLTLAGSSPTVSVQDPLNLGAIAEIHATITGNNGLTKSGAGTLILSAPATGSSPNAYANNYTGGTVVNGGTLILASGGASGEIRGALTINSNATVSLASVNALGYWNGAEVTTVNINGATLDNATSGDQGYDASYYLSGGTITNSGGGDYVLHGVTIASLSNTVASVVSAPLAIHGTNLLNAAAGATASGIDLLISGNLSPADTNNPAVTKTGAGTVELSGANTYPGTTTVSAGTLVLSGSNTLAGAVSVASSAALRLVANAGNTAGGYSAAYNLTNDLGIGSGTLQLRSDSNVTFGDIATTSHGFPGSSSITVDVNQVTPGNNGNTLSLFPNGVYTYNTTVNVTGGNGYSLAIGGINGYNAGLLLNPTTANLTIGPIGYVSYLIMNGTGVLTLTGANTYTGNTTVGTGTLLVSSSGSLAAASAVTVSNNATLGGSGTINGPVTFNAGSHAVLTQGSPLTLGSSLTIATSGTIPNVHLNLPSNLAAGTYTLATYNPAGSSGAFASTPVIDSGSVATGNTASITTSGGQVKLVVGPSVNTDPATANFQATVTGRTLNFTWAPDHQGWQLYTNAVSLTATNSWFPVLGSSSVTNEAVTINPANPNVFFQLRYP